MSPSASTQATKVTFPNQFTSMAGNLFAPPNLDKTKNTRHWLLPIHLVESKSGRLEFTREKWPREGMYLASEQQERTVDEQARRHHT
jgi:hypothetical protein